MPWPMPRLAPVTMATCPSRLFAMVPSGGRIPYAQAAVSSFHRQDLLTVSVQYAAGERPEWVAGVGGGWMV